MPRLSFTSRTARAGECLELQLRARNTSFLAANRWRPEYLTGLSALGRNGHNVKIRERHYMEDQERNENIMLKRTLGLSGWEMDETGLGSCQTLGSIIAFDQTTRELQLYVERRKNISTFPD
jgi:hypothetical protein